MKLTKCTSRWLLFFATAFFFSSASAGVAPNDQWLLKFATAAYESDANFVQTTGVPHSSLFLHTFERISDDPHVKIYSNFRFSPGEANSCVVAWRGTASMLDAFRDGQAQFGRPARIPNWWGGTWEGAYGFVQRLNHYSDDVINILETPRCAGNIYITGHSLGAALAQVHGVQLMTHPRLAARLKQIVGWNSPQVVSLAVQQNFGAYAEAVHGLAIYNRSRDEIVNHVPTGLVRLLPHNDRGLNGVTFTGRDLVPVDILPGGGRWINAYGPGAYNHTATHWVLEFSPGTPGGPAVPR